MTSPINQLDTQVLKERYYETIPGWFDYHGLYADAVQSAPPDSHLVEVGCFMGRSAAYMLETIQGSAKSLRFSMVDTWRLSEDGQPWLSDLCPSVEEWKMRFAGDKFYEQVCLNMKNSPSADYLTQMIRADSVVASKQFSDESLFFCFLDASHDFTSVKADMAAWWPKIQIGGALAGHDWTNPGVENAVMAFCDYHGFRRVLTRGNCWLILKHHFSTVDTTETMGYNRS